VGRIRVGGSPNPDLQRLALHLLDIQIEYDFSSTFVWVPWDQNIRADYLSHASEAPPHDYRLQEEWFAYLDGLWAPHFIDRFETANNRQPLGAPHFGRFCSRYFHPEAEWTDALSMPRGDENNWVFPPVHLVGAAIAHLRAY
jgi:hypothetical protein